MKFDQPLINSKNMKMLFNFLKVKNMPHKRYNDSTYLEMVKMMHHIVMQSMKIVVQKVKYIIVSYDEVTTIDNQSWCNVHAYIVGGFRKVLVLLNFERVFN